MNCAVLSAPTGKGKPHAPIRSQPLHAVSRARVPRPLRSRRARRLSRGGVSVPLCLSAGRAGGTAQGQRPAAGAVQRAARPLGQAASAASPACRAASTSSARAWSGRWPMRRRWIARACTRWPGWCRRARSAATLRQTYVDNLRWAAAQAARQGVDLLIEPINTRDIPGFYPQSAGHCARSSSRRLAPPTSRCRWTCTTARSSKATWP